MAKDRENGAPSDSIVFINARLIDPASGRDEPGGLLVRDGVIDDLGENRWLLALRQKSDTCCDTRFSAVGTVRQKIRNELN